MFFMFRMITRKHAIKKWEVSIVELQDGKDSLFKISQRIPDLSVAETRVFKDKKSAKRLFDKWLG